MKFAIEPNTNTYGKYRAVPTNYIECIEKPSDGHVLTDTWQSDPMNSSCWRLKTQVELDADADAELDEKVDFANVDPFLKGYVLAVNDGSFVPGSNYTGAQIKTIIKAKM